MTHFFFSILFLLSTYFLAVLALYQGYIPGGYSNIKGEDGKTHKIKHYGRVLGISFIIASVLTGLMFYFFVLPSYQFLQ